MEEKEIEGLSARQLQKQLARQHEEHMVLETAMEAGHILLENGAEIFRVEETMMRICRYFGVDSGSFFVLSNGIFTTGGQAFQGPYAKVQHIPVQGAHLDKVVAVNQLSREVEEGRYTIEEVRHCLQDIRQMPRKTPQMQIFASAMGSAAFCYLFGGSISDSLVAFLAGFVLHIFVLKIRIPYGMSKIISNILGGALVTLVCILSVNVGLGETLSHMISGAIIPLVPGVPFTNGIRDIADGDYISGAVRLLDALLVFLCIAIGVGLMFTIYQRIVGGVMP